MMKTINIKNILVFGAVVVFMGGCASIGPQTQKSALLGAGTGAVVSAVTGGSLVEGAVVGTAIGAGVGYIQDTHR